MKVIALVTARCGSKGVPDKNIKNIGEGELYTMFWINEFYDANDPDTYFEKV